MKNKQETIENRPNNPIQSQMKKSKRIHKTSNHNNIIMKTLAERLAKVTVNVNVTEKEIPKKERKKIRYTLIKLYVCD